MLNGIFKITFRGSADWGMGILILKDGIVTGADVGGIKYDGKYKENKNCIEINLELTVPPGATLVMGTPPQSKEYTIPIILSVNKKDIEKNETILLELPQGPVNVIFNCLRNL